MKRTSIWKRTREQARLLARGLRYRRIFGYLDIDGWLRVEEAAALFDLARSLPDRGAVVVEIGSWLGKSSVCIGHGLQGKSEATMYCIDPFNAAGDEVSADNYAERASQLGIPLIERFRQNLASEGVLDVARITQGFSHEIADRFDGEIDMLFIDGDHSYEGVRRDFEQWSPRVKAGGVIALHDVGRTATPGPGQVVDEFLRDSAEWCDGRLIRSLYVARRARGH